MKTRLALSTLASAVASSLLFAADNTPTSSSVDLPVTRIEVTVALKQYEKVQSLLMDAELNRKLQNADPNIAKENGAALEMRIEILKSELKDLRTFAEDALKAARDRLERETAAAERIRTEAKINDPDPENGDAQLLLPDPRDVGIDAHIAAKIEMGNYLAAKSRRLKAKNHWQKLDALCQ